MLWVRVCCCQVARMHGQSLGVHLRLQALLGFLAFVDVCAAAVMAYVIVLRQTPDVLLLFVFEVRASVPGSLLFSLLVFSCSTRFWRCRRLRPLASTSWCWLMRAWTDAGPTRCALIAAWPTLRVPT